MAFFILVLLPILVALSSGYLLTIWFDGSKFFLEYAKLFRIHLLIPHLKKFIRMREEGSPYEYLDYIAEFKDCFLTRLVTCPKCLSAWVNGFSFLLQLGCAFLVAKELFLLLLILSPFYIFAESFLSLYLYFKLKKL